MEVTTVRDFENRAQKRQKRSSRPCDACRKRKSRCIIKEDAQVCVHCDLRETPCTFREEPPDRLRRRQSQSADTDEHTAEKQATAGTSNHGELSSRERVPARVSMTPSIDAATVAPEPIEDPENYVPTLGSAPTRFAELYGLGSDMEPILMRFRPYHKATQEFK